MRGRVSWLSISVLKNIFEVGIFSDYLHKNFIFYGYNNISYVMVVINLISFDQLEWQKSQIQAQFQSCKIIRKSALKGFSPEVMILWWLVL